MSSASETRERFVLVSNENDLWSVDRSFYFDIAFYHIDINTVVKVEGAYDFFHQNAKQNDFKKLQQNIQTSA